jgi:hypothetical protein
MSCDKILKALCCCSRCCNNDKEISQRPTLSIEVEGEVQYHNYEEAFSYENLTRKRGAEFERYEAAVENDFFKVSRKDAPEKASPVGWKIHISLDDADKGERSRDDPSSENISKAWNIVKSVLIENRMDFFKVVVPNAIADERALSHQVGRQITIYANDLRKPYDRIIQTITDRFVEQGIKPGLKPNIDRPIQGSSFFTYRNDNDGDGNYLSAKDAKSYNQTTDADPFQNMLISNPNQLPGKYRKTDIRAIFTTDNSATPTKTM